MKIIILAAGTGERLMPLTQNTPKPLLDMGNGKTLLEEQIARIQKSGVIDEIVLVVGYLSEQIEAKIRHIVNSTIPIRTIYNPFYDISNNLISLWLAQHEMESDFLITNGDNLFSSEIFERFVRENQNGIFLTTCVKLNYEEDSMKVTIDNNAISKVHKKIKNDKVAAESPGLVLVKGSRNVRLFLDSLDSLVKNGKHRNSYWLEVFNDLYNKGVLVQPWAFEAENHWREIDFHLDVQKVKDLLCIAESKHERVH